MLGLEIRIEDYGTFKGATKLQASIADDGWSGERRHSNTPAQCRGDVIAVSVVETNRR